MDKEDKEKITEILEESQRLKKGMKYLRIIALCQTLAIMGASYRIHQLENILVKMNQSLMDLAEITGGYHDIFVELINFLYRVLGISSI